MRRLQVRFLLGSQRKWLKVGIKPLNQQNDLSYWRLPVIISYINKITKVGEKVKPSYSADTMRYGRNWVPKGIKNYWRVVLIRGTSFVVFLRCMPCKWFGRLAEWSIAAVLKTVELRGSVGSNPTSSAKVSSFFGKNEVELSGGFIYSLKINWWSWWENFLSLYGEETQHITA